MSNASRHTGRGVLIAIFFSLVFVLGATRAELNFRTPFHDQGDAAVNALQIYNAKHATELYGNYSRFEFNHPGPAFFYIYGIGEWLLHDVTKIAPAPSNAHLLAAIALQSFFFALALAILSTHLPWRALLPLALVAAALHFGPLREPFVSIWPPHQLLMPFLCFMVVCTSVASGQARNIPWMILTGGFLFHGHVAQPLFVGTLGGLALFLCARQLRADRNPSWRELLREHRQPLWRAVAILALFLLPLALDVITRGPLRSNLATIIGRFVKNTEESVTLAQSALYFLSFATPARDQDVIFAELGPKTWAFFAEHGWRIALWLAVLVTPTIFVFTARKRLAPEERAFFLSASWILGATLFGCLLWGKAQAGGMQHFNGYFYYGIYFFAAVLVLALIARSLERFSLRYAGHAACVVAATLIAVDFRSGPLNEPELGLRLSNGTLAALHADPDRRPKIVVFEHVHWHNVAGVLLELQRHGGGFYVAPWWNFMFQERHDLNRLGGKPEEKAAVWWITADRNGGQPITEELNIHFTPAPLDPKGAEISFKGGGNGFRYLVSGVTAGNIEYAATNEPRVVLQFKPLPTDRDVRLTFDVASDNGDQPAETAEVLVNGQSLGRISVAKRAEISVTVPAALWNRAAEATLELNFPKPTAHRSYRRPDYEWWSAWQLWRIKVDTPTPGATAAASLSAR